jgi:hypothetical protein
MDANTPIKLDLTLNEVEGVLAGLGDLPTKTGAFTLLMKIKIQTEAQLPKEEPKVEDVNPEDIKAA